MSQRAQAGLGGIRAFARLALGGTVRLGDGALATWSVYVLVVRIRRTAGGCGLCRVHVPSPTRDTVESTARNAACWISRWLVAGLR